MSTLQRAPNWQVGAFGDALYLKWFLFKINRFLWFPDVTKKMKNANTWITPSYVISATRKHLYATSKTSLWAWWPTPTVVLNTLHYTNIIYYVSYYSYSYYYYNYYVFCTMQYALCTLRYRLPPTVVFTTKVTRNLYGPEHSALHEHYVLCTMQYALNIVFNMHCTLRYRLPPTVVFTTKVTPPTSRLTWATRRCLSA